MEFADIDSSTLQGTLTLQNGQTYAKGLTLSCHNYYLLSPSLPTPLLPPPAAY